jgi:SAM-dependent methyltransferase
MVPSGPSVREVPDVTMGDHFGRVAAVYESLRTTDEAPVRASGQFLPDRPVTGLDVGCGTGRYSRLLGELLPDGSLLAATDVSAAMLAQLTAGLRGHPPGVVPRRRRRAAVAGRQPRSGHRVQLLE